MSTNQEDVENEPTTSYSVMIFDSCGRIRPCPNETQNQASSIRSENQNVFIYNPSTFPTNDETFIEINNQIYQTPARSTEAKLKLLCSVLLEDNVDQVRESLSMGCFCIAKNCFENLDPDTVYQHRLRLSQLDRAEHNMFLMGVLVTCFTNTKGLKKRLYIKYCYNNKRVCKEAFLYLNMCTYQQLADVREHLRRQGVSTLQRQDEWSARQEEHFNSFYNPVKQFLSCYLKRYVGEAADIDSNELIHLPFGASKKNLYDAYKLYVDKHFPGHNSLNYVLFRDYLQKYFPQVIFYRFGAKPGSKPKPLGELQWVNDIDSRRVQVVSPYTVIPPHRTYGNCTVVEASASEASISTFEEVLDE